MRVFVAGASGVIGRRLLPQLIAAGHEPTGMTRSERGAAEIRAAGADATVCDVFDPEGLERAMVAARPEAVIHELTSLPDRMDLRKPDYGPNNRIRSEGTRNLLAGARGAGARRFVAQSIAFIYETTGPRVLDEDAPVMEESGEGFGAAVRATMDLERQVRSAEGLEGVVLRYGFFYGPGTYYGEGGSQAEDVRRRRAPVVGNGDGVFSFIHVDDASAATVLALDRGDGVYNVVDDDPAPMREWLPVFADAIGAKRPLRVPAWVARLAAGSAAVGFATEMRGASNGKAKRELGWEPTWPSWRLGFAEAPR